MFISKTRHLVKFLYINQIVAYKISYKYVHEKSLLSRHISEELMLAFTTQLTDIVIVAFLWKTQHLAMFLNKYTKFFGIVCILGTAKKVDEET